MFLLRIYFSFSIFSNSACSYTLSWLIFYSISAFNLLSSCSRSNSIDLLKFCLCCSLIFSCSSLNFLCSNIFWMLASYAPPSSFDSPEVLGFFCASICFILLFRSWNLFEFFYTGGTYGGGGRFKRFRVSITYSMRYFVIRYSFLGCTCPVAKRLEKSLNPLAF